MDPTDLLKSAIDGQVSDRVLDMLPPSKKVSADAREIQETLKLIELYEDMLRDAGLEKWFVPGSPYGIENCPKHRAFFDAGKDYRERIFMAANRVGKSVAGAYEAACHATGLYPSWWNGRVFEEPTHGWVVGSTARQTRDVVQKELLGAIGSPGTGMIPAHLMGRSWALGGVPQGIDVIEVKHVSGGWSTIGFKNYEQDIKAFGGTAKDYVWLDEECPDLIYNECFVRTMTTNGIMLVTFTPQHGLTSFVVRFCQKADFIGSDRPKIAQRVEDKDDSDNSLAVLSASSKAAITAGWDDALWLSEETKRVLLDDTPPYLRDARSKGIPAMGSGNIYPIAVEDILVAPFSIPDHFKRVYGLDVGWKRTAVVWIAVDPNSDTAYVYDEYYVGEKEPAVHAEAIKTRGNWIQGVVDPASRGRSQIDGQQLIRMYKDLGLKIRPANNSVDSGIANVWNRLSAGKLKVFSHLHNFAKEYMLYRRDIRGNIVKEDDHLMDATRYAVAALPIALTRSQIVPTGIYNGTRKYDV